MSQIAQAQIERWLKRASVESVESSDIWSKLYRAFGWSKHGSLALSLAEPMAIKGPCLIATPVKVILGMRDSECHALCERDSQISESQVTSFNEFFDGVFRLHPYNELHYLVEFNELPKFQLSNQFWPPHLADYRVQVQAAKGELVRHLTELQAWCHQQDSVWNALYLWGNINPSSVALPSVLIDDKTENSIFSTLALLESLEKTPPQKKIIAIDHLGQIESSLDQIESELHSSKIDKLTISFSDNELYHLNSLSLKPWWKKLIQR